MIREVLHVAVCSAVRLLVVCVFLTLAVAATPVAEALSIPFAGLSIGVVLYDELANRKRHRGRRA